MLRVWGLSIAFLGSVLIDSLVRLASETDVSADKSRRLLSAQLRTCGDGLHIEVPEGYTRSQNHGALREVISPSSWSRTALAGVNGPRSRTAEDRSKVVIH
jgi:hypothetical protein